jgi:hypothetical protein
MHLPLLSPVPECHVWKGNVDGEFKTHCVLLVVGVVVAIGVHKRGKSRRSEVPIGFEYSNCWLRSCARGENGSGDRVADSDSA